jgi:hypothetical protein
VQPNRIWTGYDLVPQVDFEEIQVVFCKKDKTGRPLKPLL